MNWLGGNNLDYRFELFSASHLSMLAIFFGISLAMFKQKENLRSRSWRTLEISFAVSLILFETGYHLWLFVNGFWKLSQAIPVELCSISLILTILLLLTGKKLVFELLFFTALLGASQAIATPLLYYDFPHFRFFHFFYTHLMMMWVSLYFLWVKGFRPTILSVIKGFVFMNLLVPIVLLINKLVDGNYMFLSHKPKTPSLSDYMGLFPWYILSLEGAFIVLSLLVWLIFRKKEKHD